jgi:hypothetical protein
MRMFHLWVPMSALAIAISVAGSASSQSTTQSETTVTTVPTVTSKTVTKKTVINGPPAVIVNRPAIVMNPPPVSSETTTESTRSDYPAPTVEERTNSRTTYSPFGVTHSETREKTTSHTDEDSED